MRAYIQINVDRWLSKIKKSRQLEIRQFFIKDGDLILFRTVNTSSGVIHEGYHRGTLTSAKRRVARATARKPLKLSQTILFHTL